MPERENSVAICGINYGDEGKGKLADRLVEDFLIKGLKVIVYRDNGGANAGHTIELADGRRVATHQIPSGIFYPEAIVVLGKGMVIHPGDLMTEIEEMTEVNGKKGIAEIMIDEMALLSLDTHRAMESIENSWFDGGKGSTGRGITPAYSDETHRHPLRVRDLIRFDENKIREHYRYYQAEISGLGGNLEKIPVFKYKSEEKIPVGTEDEFVERLRQQAERMRIYVSDVNPFLRSAWSDGNYAFVFEKAQAIGLDKCWGVYPDVTASNTTFSGIFSSTEGIVDPNDIPSRRGVIKSTYMSSVGIRELPTMLEKARNKNKPFNELTAQEQFDIRLAETIRKDFKEYGASTGRPRGIAYLDMPSTRFFSKVGNVNEIALTHMDAVYPGLPIRVCVDYLIDGKSDYYRPDQEHLLKVEPKYIELPTWSREQIQQARTSDDLPREAKNFIEFIKRETGIPVTIITNGPKRNQSINLI